VITPAQQVVQTIPLGGIADPVSFNYNTPDRASKKQAYIEQQRRFQALLADHQQQVKLSSVSKVKESEEPQEKVEDLPK
jgi:sigma-E factor negative regulatory protein RseA